MAQKHSIEDIRIESLRNAVEMAKAFPGTPSGVIMQIASQFEDYIKYGTNSAIPAQGEQVNEEAKSETKN